MKVAKMVHKVSQYPSFPSSSNVYILQNESVRSEHVIHTNIKPLTNLQTLFKFHQIVPLSFYCSRSHTTLSHPVCLVGLLQSGTVAKSFSVFHDLDSFEEYCPVTLYSVPQFRFVCSFLLIKLNLWIWGKNNT